MSVSGTLPFICPKHPEQVLTLVLQGGAGWCSRCYCYVQSANHPEPTLTPEQIAKREAGRIEEARQKRNAAAKRRKHARKSNAEATA